MMPCNFKEANILLNKPKSMTDEECFSGLPAYKGKDGDGFDCFVTLWLPSKEDIEAILAGRGIAIKTIGTEFAPMSVYTIDENGHIN